MAKAPPTVPRAASVASAGKPSRNGALHTRSVHCRRHAAQNGNAQRTAELRAGLRECGCGAGALRLAPPLPAGRWPGVNTGRQAKRDNMTGPVTTHARPGAGADLAEHRKAERGKSPVRRPSQRPAGRGGPMTGASMEPTMKARTEGTHPPTRLQRRHAPAPVAGTGRRRQNAAKAAKKAKDVDRQRDAEGGRSQQGAGRSADRPAGADDARKAPRSPARPQSNSTGDQPKPSCRELLDAIDHRQHRRQRQRRADEGRAGRRSDRGTRAAAAAPAPAAAPSPARPSRNTAPHQKCCKHHAAQQRAHAPRRPSSWRSTRRWRSCAARGSRNMLRISESVEGASVAPATPKQRLGPRSASPALVAKAASTEASAERGGADQAAAAAGRCDRPACPW